MTSCRCTFISWQFLHHLFDLPVQVCACYALTSLARARRQSEQVLRNSQTRHAEERARFTREHQQTVIVKEDYTRSRLDSEVFMTIIRLWRSTACRMKKLNRKVYISQCMSLMICVLLTPDNETCAVSPLDVQSAACQRHSDSVIVIWSLRVMAYSSQLFVHWTVSLDFTVSSRHYVGFLAAIDISGST